MILVTGATGLIGSHLCKRLVLEGNNVIGLIHDRANPILESLLENKNFKVYYGDIKDRDSIKDVFNNNHIDTVFHLAAHVPHASDLDYGGVNVQGTCNLLIESLANDIQRFIYASTMNVYSEPPIYLPITEDHPTTTIDSYGISKLRGEQLCKSHSKYMDITIVRYASVYGKGSREPLVVARFVNNALSNSPITIDGDGGQSRDFIYVNSAVDGTYLVWRKGLSSVYNIGSGEETTILELARSIVKILKSKSEIVFTGVESRNPFRLVSDISKARHELGYLPITLEEGLPLYAKEILDES